MRKRKRANSSDREMRRDVRLTFWQQSINSSMVTTPSLFLSIFCWRRGEGHDEKQCHGYCDLHLRRRRVTCLKEHLYMLTWRVFFEDWVRAFSHHVVDGLHDVQHLLQCTGKRGQSTGMKCKLILHLPPTGSNANILVFHMPHIWSQRRLQLLCCL